MARISFSYLPYLHKDPKTEEFSEKFRPNVLVKLSNGGNLTNSIDCLVDSGSDRNLFPLHLGELVEINFRKIKSTDITGIGGYQISAYSAKINIWIGNKKFETEADFSPYQQIPLLGRDGFFSSFKEVIFAKEEKFLHLELHA